MQADAATRKCRQIVKIGARIAHILHGIPREVQGAVLADLTATWLAGFQGPDAPAVRAEILKVHVKAIVEMIPVNEAIMWETRGDRRAPANSRPDPDD